MIRGGYGIMYLPNGTEHIATTNFGFSSATSMLTTVDGITPANTLSNPFPQGEVPPLGSSQGLLTGLGQSINTWPRNVRVGYVQMYNLNVQRELPGSILLEAGYVGTHGIGVPADFIFNQLPDQYLSMGQSLLTLVPNPFYGYVQQGVYSQKTIQQGYLLRPFPQFSGISATFDAGLPGGYSVYNSFQLRADKRFSQGFAILGAYTNSKLITDASNNQTFTGDINAPIQNYNNRRAERSLSSQDVSQRLVINYIYDLPWGPGKRWLGSAHGPLARLVEGWRLAVTTFQTGFPLVPTISVNNTRSFGGGARPNNNGLSAKLPGSQRTVNQWFNTAVFSQPAPFTFGNVGRTLPDVRSDGIRNFDFSILKTTGISERVKLEFRADAFNLFNTPQFGVPGTTFGTASFGVVSSQANSPRVFQLGLRLVF